MTKNAGSVPTLETDAVRAFVDSPVVTRVWRSLAFSTPAAIVTVAVPYLLGDQQNLSLYTEVGRVPLFPGLAFFSIAVALAGPLFAVAIGGARSGVRRALAGVVATSPFLVGAGVLAARAPTVIGTLQVVAAALMFASLGAYLAWTGFHPDPAQRDPVGLENLPPF